MINVCLLRSKIVLHDDTNDELASALGIHRATFYKKLNGNSEFVASEIIAIKERYNLTVQEVQDIFFANEVS